MVFRQIINTVFVSRFDIIWLLAKLKLKRKNTAKLKRNNNWKTKTKKNQNQNHTVLLQTAVKQNKQTECVVYYGSLAQSSQHCTHQAALRPAWLVLGWVTVDTNLIFNPLKGRDVNWLHLAIQV